jgi:FG-GAP repeat
MHAIGPVLVAAMVCALLAPMRSVADVPVPRPPADIGHTSDLNGDGYGDLVIGTPNEKRSKRAGAVNIMYGSPTGIASSGAQVWTQRDLHVPVPIHDENGFGGGVATADFNGDGYADLAVGASGQNLGWKARHAGVLYVVFGSPTGLTADGDQLWSQDSPGVLGKAEEGDRFGDILATGDLNADGYADLVIGVASEDLGARVNAGAVQVLFGSPSGLSADGNQRWTQDSDGVPDAAEYGDEFGLAVAVGRFNDDAAEDLAIGAHLESLTRPTQGAVTVLYGSPLGPTASDAQLWDRDSPGIRGEAKIADRFGHSLVAGDWNGDRWSDLAIAVPQGPPKRGGGAVNVLYGSAVGLIAAGNQLWNQDSPGIENRRECAPAESNWCDLFGWAVGGGDFDGDGFDDLAVGVPGEDLAHVVDMGAVHVIYGSPTGLTSVGNRLWSQDSTGIGDRGETSDRFGWTVFGTDLGSGRQDDLIVSVAWEDLSQRRGDAGMVQVLYGSPEGITAIGSQRWTQDSPGVPDKAERGDLFGQRLPGSGYPA